MRHDFHNAMHLALTRGPEYCPPDLFVGVTDRVALGLKAHANSIAHARHVALQDSFPRTRALLGDDRFHVLARQYLDRSMPLLLPLAKIGRAFPEWLEGPACDLARVEWAWLEAHGAADADPFDLDAIAGLTAKEVASSRVIRHPAARMTNVDHSSVVWDGLTLADTHVLITRPELDVRVCAAGEAATRLFIAVDRPIELGSMLDTDVSAATQLVTAGALMLASEDRQ